MTHSSKSLHIQQRECSQQDRLAIEQFINSSLRGNEFLESKNYIPISASSQTMFEKFSDGFILAHMVNICDKNAINMNKLILPKSRPLNVFQVNENVKYVLSCCKNLGLLLINIGVEDIRQCSSYLIASLIFQLIRLQAELQLQIEISRNKRILEEMGIFSDKEGNNSEKVLIEFFQQCIKINKSKMQCRNLKDLSNYKIIAQALHAKLPLVFTSQDMKLDGIELAQRICDVARQINVPNVISPQELITPGSKLVFPFAVQVTVKLMQLPKISEQTLLKFINNMSDLSENISGFDSLILPEAVYNIVSKQTGKKSQEFEKFNPGQDKEELLFKYLQEVGAIQINLNELQTLPEHAKKEILSQAIEKIFLNNVASEKDMRQWIQKALQISKAEVDEYNLRENVDPLAIKLLSTLTTNPQLSTDYVNTKNNDERRDILSQELKKHDIVFPYNSQQLIGSQPEIQYFLLDLIKNRFPINQDEEGNINEQTLIDCIESLIPYERNRIQAIDGQQILNDVDKLQKYITDDLKIKLKMQNNQMPHQKTEQLICALSEQLKTQVSQTKDLTFQEQKQQLNNLVTKAVQSKLPPDDIIFEFVNLRSNQNIYYKTMSVQELYFNYPIQLIDQGIYKDAIVFYQEQKDDFLKEKQVVQKHILQELLGKLDLGHQLNNLMSNTGIHFMMNQLIQQITPQDQFIIQQIEVLLGSKVEGFKQVDQIQKFLNLVAGANAANFNESVAKALQKTYKQSVQANLQTYLAGNTESKVFKLFLADCLNSYHQAMQPYVKQNTAYTTQVLKNELGNEQGQTNYKQLISLINSPSAQVAEYKNLLGLILATGPEVVKQLSLKQSNSSQSNSFQNDDAKNLQNYYSLCNHFILKSGMTPPYSVDKVVKQQSMAFPHYLYSIQNLCLKSKQHYMHLINQYKKDAGISIGAVQDIQQLQDSDYVTLINSMYPSVAQSISPDDKSLQSCLNACSMQDICMELNTDDLPKEKMQQLNKILLKQVLKDKVQQDTFLTDMQFSSYLNGINPGDKSQNQLQKLIFQTNTLLAERTMQQINTQNMSNEEMALQLHQKLKQLNLIDDQIDSALIAQQDQKVLQAIQTVLLEQSMVPQQLLLDGVNTYATVYDKTAFNHLLGIDENAPFQQTCKEMQKLQIPFPYNSEEELNLSSEKLNSGILSQIYTEKVMQKKQQIQDTILEKLFENHVQTLQFDGNKRGQTLELTDKNTFGHETLMQSIMQFVPECQRQLEQIQANSSLNDLNKMQKTLDVLSENNIIYDHFVSSLLINNDAKQLTLFFNQLIQNDNKREDQQGDNQLSAETVQECIRIYLKNQYLNNQIKSNEQYSRIFKECGFENRGDGNGFTIQTLASPQNFMLIFNLLTNDYISLNKDKQGENTEDVFESILQQLQNKNYQTQFCKSSDMLICQSKQYLKLMTDILRPKQFKMQQIIQEFNKYLKNNQSSGVLINFEDLQNEELFTSIYSAMYNNYTKNDKIGFFIGLKVPVQLLKLSAPENNPILNMICQIPYDTTTDYIHCDESNIVNWVSNMKIFNKVNSINDIQLNQLAQVAAQIATDKYKENQSDFEKIKEILSQNQIPIVFENEQQLVDNPKTKLVVLNQIKYNQQISFMLLQKIYNNLRQIYGFKHQLIDQADLMKPQTYIELFKISKQQTDFYNTCIQKPHDEQLKTLFEQTKKLNICTPISLQNLLRNKKLQILYSLDIIMALLPDEELVKYCNLLFQLKSKTEFIKQIIDISSPQTMVTFIQSNNLNKYQNLTPSVQIQELVQIIQGDQDYICKPNYSNFTHPNHLVFKTFIIEQYHNQINIQHMPILKQEHINQFMEENDVAIKNFNIKQNESKQLIKLLKKLDPEYQSVETQDQVFQKLSQEFPQMDIVFMLNDHEDIDKYNLTVLSQLYMKYKILDNIKLLPESEIVNWVNMCLKHQQNSQVNKIAKINDLYDGIVIANLLSLIQQDQSIIPEFENKKGQNKHFEYLIQASEKDKKIIPCLQEADFIDGNESAFQIFISQLYSDIDQILDSCVMEKQTLLQWINGKCIEHKCEQLSLESFNQKEDQMVMFVNTLYNQSFKEASDVLSYITDQNGFNIKYKLTSDHLTNQYNHAAIQLLYDSMCVKDLIQLKHLLIYLNVKFPDAQKLSSLKTTNVQIFDVLLKFIKQTHPQQLIPDNLQDSTLDQKKRLFQDVAVELNLEHLINDSVLKTNAGGDLYLFTDVLYKQQIKSIPEYANWINGILARARKPELFLKTAEINEKVLNCIFEYYYPQSYLSLEKEKSWNYKQSTNPEINKFLSFLKSQFGVDYITENDITSNSQKLCWIIDLVISDKQDFGAQKTLPENFMRQILYTSHPYKDQIQKQDALQPHNIILSFYGLAVNQIPELQNLSACQSFDEQAHLFLISMKNYDQKLAGKLQEIDWYEYGYNADASKYAASECLIELLSKNDPIDNCTAYINALLLDEDDDLDQISSLSRIQDAKSLVKLLSYTSTYQQLYPNMTKSAIEQQDQKQCFDQIVALIQATNPMTSDRQLIKMITPDLDESDLSQELVVSLLTDCVVGSIKRSYLHSDVIQQILRDTFKDNKLVTSYDPQVIIQSPETMKAVLKEVCKVKEVEQTIPKEVIPKCIDLIDQMDNNTIIDSTKKVLRNFGDKINEQLFDPNISPQETSNIIFTSIVKHLVQQSKVDDQLNSYVQSVWGTNEYGINTQSLCDNKQTALQILSLLVEQKPENLEGLSEQQVEQKLSMIFNKMDISQFCDAQNYQNPDIMKVIVQYAFDIVNKQQDDEKILQDIWSRNQLLMQKQLTPNDVIPITIDQVKSICPLAIVLNRVNDQLFNNYIIYNRTQPVHNADKVDKLSIAENYNACQEVMSNELNIDLDGISGHDLQDYSKFYYNWINEQIAEKEIQRVEKLLQKSISQQLLAKQQLTDRNAEIDINMIEKLLEDLIPGMQALIEQSNQNEKTQFVLDIIRGSSIIHIITLPQFQRSPVIRMYLAALLLEVLEQQKAQ